MIQRIQQIKSFGVFDNFQWPTGLPEFKQFNLIYGWNYSGKTTLSRVFRCFEQKRPHTDFPEAQIQLKAADGTIYTLHSPQNAPLFRVFNRDFVNDNIHFDSSNAASILVLGAADIAKQERLKTKRVEGEVLSLSMHTNKQNRDKENADIETTLTNYARDQIKNPLSVPNYDKRRFLSKVNECKAHFDTFLLDDKTLAECYTMYRSTDKKQTIALKTNLLSSITEANNKAATLLARVVTANNPIPLLKENPALEIWVKQGISLHEGVSFCQFCRQPLPADLLSHLTGHFSADYENLMTELNTLEEHLNDMLNERILLNSKSDFYQEIQEQYATGATNLNNIIEIRKIAIRTIQEAVVNKKTMAFTSLENPDISNKIVDIAPAIEAINKTITEHNNRTEDFDLKRDEAFKKIELHIAAGFVRDQKYNERRHAITNLDATIVEQTKNLEAITNEIRELEKDVSEASKGAERINELLAAYFGKNDLRITVTGNKIFQITRRGVNAKNLSEGEKTAIAFAYFITCVQDGQHSFENTRIVIDDPISSLDANHLFNTYALIKTQLGDCRQIFIATHSFEFYNLIREWAADDEGQGHADKPQTSWKKWSIYYLKLHDNGKAELEEIPITLLRFKSEYHYLFSTLYTFDKVRSPNFGELLSLPNIVRRFMEAFGGIMIPRRIGLHKKMPKFFRNTIECERVWKFMNHYSHHTTIIRSLVIPDLSECKEVVHACLNAVRDWDNEYFADLEAEVS